jgi:hypothetical protein
MVELGSHAATERAAMVTLHLTVSRARILSRQLHARICEGKAEWLRYSTNAEVGQFGMFGPTPFR